MDEFDCDEDDDTLPPTGRTPRRHAWELRELPRRPHDPPGVQRFVGRHRPYSNQDEVDALLAGEWDM